MEAAYRALPSVDRVLQELQPILETEGWPHGLVVEAIRAVLEECRREIAGGGAASLLEVVVARAVQRVQEWLQSTLRPAINASGVILHTNLGRAPLSAAALEAVC